MKHPLVPEAPEFSRGVAHRFLIGSLESINVRAGKSYRALKIVLILISVKFMHKIVPFEEFQFLVKSYLSKFFSSHASISPELQR